MDSIFCFHKNDANDAMNFYTHKRHFNDNIFNIQFLMDSWLNNTTFNFIS